MTEATEICLQTYSSAGNRTDIKSDSRFFVKNGKYHVLFSIDGDKCRISFDQEGCTYRRQGDLSYELNLSKGQKSTVTIVTEHGVSDLSCFTHSYNMSEFRDAIMINIKYNMAEEDCEMEITIKEKL